MRLKIKENILTEGPGAGYTITGNIESLDIKSIVEVVQEDDKLFINGILGTANISNITARSYYDSGEIRGTIQADLSNAIIDISDEYNKIFNSFDPYQYEDDDDMINQVTTDPTLLIPILKDLFEDLKFEDMIGGGYSHSTFDGELSAEDPDEYSSINLKIKDQTYINYIDDAVTGGAVESYYEVFNKSGDLLDTFGTEDAAVEYYEKTSEAASLEEYRYAYYYDDDLDVDFYSEPYINTLYTK